MSWFENQELNNNNVAKFSSRIRIENLQVINETFWDFGFGVLLASVFGHNFVTFFYCPCVKKWKMKISPQVEERYHRHPWCRRSPV